LNDLAINHYKKKEYAEALEKLGQLKAFCSQSREVWMMFIECLMESKRFKQMQAELATAVLLLPTFADDSD